MKRKLFVWILTIVMPIFSVSAQVTVNVTTPGTMWETMDDMGISADTVTNLKVTGSLNSTDYQVFRKITTSLNRLDLSELNIDQFPCEGAFRDMTSLRNIILPTTMTTFRSYTFNGCTNLVRLSFGIENAQDSIFVFPSNVIDFGYYSFQSCPGIKELDLSACHNPVGNVYLHGDVFNSCNKLQKVTMPNSNYGMEYSCFLYTNVKEFTVTKYCQEFGDSMFDKLRLLYVECVTPPYARSNPFSYVDRDSLITYVPIGSKRLYRLTDGWDKLIVNNIIEAGLQVKMGDNGAVLYNGSILENGAIIFHNAQETQLTIRPNAGYEIASVTVDNVPATVTEGTLTIPEGTIGGTIRVSFAQKTLTVNATISGQGTVKLNGDAIASGYAASIAGGAKLVFTLIPDAGYAVQSVTCNGSAVVLMDNGTTYTINALNENSNLVFTFVEESTMGTTYNISFAQKGHGNVLYLNDVIPAGAQVRVNQGENVALSFYPTEDFVFQKLEVDGVDVTADVVNGSYTIQNVQADVAVSTTFYSSTHITLTLQGGDLMAKLTELSIPMNSVQSLEIIGAVDVSDFAVIRGGMTSLKKLDISQVSSLIQIPDYAFQNNTSVEQIYLPLSVTTIGQHAFENCSALQRISGCDNIKYIGQGAFYNCSSLNHVPWGDYLVQIKGDHTFAYCKSLPSYIKFPSSFINFDGDYYVMSEASGINTLDFSECDNFTGLGYICLGGLPNVTEVILPKNASSYSLGHMSLSETSIKSLTLTNGLTSINDETVFPKTLTTLNIELSTPPTCNVKAFNQVNQTACVLNVPTGSFLNYRITAPWSGFTTINEAGLQINYNEPNGVVSYEGDKIASGKVIFHESAEVILSLEPATGYEAVKAMLSTTELPIVNNTITIPAGTPYGTITVTFAQKSLNVYTSTIGNGIVVCNQHNLAALDTIAFQGGESLEFTLTPDSGYNVKSITFNGEEIVLRNGGLTYTTPQLGDNASIAFEFVSHSALVNTSVISVEIQGEGVVAYNGAQLSTGDQIRVNNGEDIPLRFMPDGDFSIASVLLNDSDITSGVINGNYMINNIQSDVALRVKYTSLTKLYLTLTGGDLYNQMMAMGVSLPAVTALTVTGTILESDITVIKNVLPSLTYLDLSGTQMTEVPARAFQNMSNLTDVLLPKTVTIIKEWAFYSCTSLQRISGCENVEIIQGWAFEYCRKLKNLPFGSKLRYVYEDSAFGECNSFPQHIVLPATLTHLRNYAFHDCANLVTVDMSACTNLQNIGYECFRNANKLKEVKLPSDAAYNIEDRAFINTSIETITIPAMVTSLGNGVFPSSLKVLNMEAFDPVDCGSGLFDDVNQATCVLNVPAGSSLSYRLTSPWSGFTNISESGIMVRCGVEGIIYHNDTKVPNGSIVFHNQQATTFTITPNSGYMIKAVIFGSQIVNPSENGTYIVGEGVESDTLSVTFALKKFDIAVTTSGEGVIQYADSSLLPNAVIAVDSSRVAVLSLVPDSGYMVKRILFNNEEAIVQNQNNVISYITPAISGESTILVEFAPASEFADMALLTFDISENGGVMFKNTTLLAQTSIFLSKGQDATFTLVPETGYTIDSLFCNGINWKDSIINNLFTLSNIDSTDIAIAFKLNTHFEINVETPGTLSRLVTKEQKAAITHLTLTGELSNSDFIALRDEFTHLAVLDMYGTTNTHIPDYAFCADPGSWENEAGKQTLVEVRLPEHVSSIGYCAFAGCTNLTKVNFEELYELQHLHERIFASTALVNVDLSNTRITDITNHEFRYCKKLKTVELPSTLMNLSSNPFSKSLIQEIDLSVCTGLTTIGGYTFQDCAELESIILPTNLKTIGSYAFNNCAKLTSFDFPSTIMSIGEGAFWNTNLTSADLKATGVTRIDNHVFRECKSLKTVILPSALTSIGDASFYYCTELENINFEDLTSLASLNNNCFRHTAIHSADLSRTAIISIPNEAFCECYSLETVKLPNTVTTLGESVFNTTAIEYINLPEGLTTIGNYAFCNTILHGKLTLPSTLTTINERAFEHSDFSIIYSNAVVPPTIHSSSFNDNVTIVFVPENSASAYKNADVWEDYTILGGEVYAEVTVTNPGNLAVDIMEQDSVAPGLVTHLKVHGAINATDFAVMRSNMTVLYDLDLSDADVSVIPENAFLDKTVLMHIKLPNNLLMIDSRAFSGCTSLSDTLVLPPYLKTIGIEAFRNCKNIRYLQMDSALEVIRNYAFQGCSSLTQELTFPEQFTSLGEFAFADCYNLYGTVTFNEEFYLFIGAEGYHSEIGNTFQHCRNISRVDMQNCQYVYELPSAIFEGCSSLEHIDLPIYLERIDEYAFQNCSSLTDIEFPTSLLFINYYAFDNCSSLKALNLNECTELGTIAEYAFHGCSSLKTVNLPNSITYIGNRAFEECRDLMNLNVEARVPADLGEYVFRRVNTEECVLSIPTASFNDYLTAAQWGAFVQMRKAINVTLDEGATLTYSKGSYANNSARRGIKAKDPTPTPTPQTKERGDAKVKDGSSLYVQDQDVITFYIEPEENVSIDKVLFNNQDVTDQLQDNVFQTPEVTETTSFAVLLNVTGPIPAREVALDHSEIAIKVAESQTLNATIYPHNTTNKNIIWTVEDELIAHVNQAGVVTGASAGVTNVVATTEDGGFIARCQVTVMSNDYYFLMSSETTFVQNTVNIPVSLFNSGITSGFQCDVYLPEGLYMEDYGGDFGIQLSGRANGHIVSAARRSDGSVRVVVYSLNGTPFSGTEDVLFNFPISTQDTSGVFEVNMRNIHIAGPNYYDFVAPDIVAQIEVNDYPLGDSNGDGYVTVSDVTNTVNHLLERETPRFISKPADANRDKIITVADVSATIDIIIERPHSAPAHLLKNIHTSETTDSLSIDDFEIRSGESKVINVGLVNTRPYTAFQCDIFVPEGLHIATDGSGNPMITLGSRTMASHIISAAEVENGSIRVIAISLNNDNFADTEGSLFSMSVEADAVATGTDTLKIQDIRLVASGGYEEYFAPNLTTIVSFVDQESGNESPEAQNELIIYAVGHQLSIESTKATTKQLMSVDGKTSMLLNILPGKNMFYISNAGVYIIDKQKIVVY